MTGPTKQMWLSESILDWNARFSGGTIIDPSRVQRPHELLLHAQALLRVASSDLSLADAISNLKRSIHSRLQHLEELYGFSQRFPKSQGALERLDAVGLAKPFLIKKLFELRNDIEHNDAVPPSIERCRELADITWYFLKTTDYACKKLPHDVVLECLAGNSHRQPTLCVTVQFSQQQPTKVEVIGWLSPAELSEVPLPGFLPMEIKRLRSKEAFNPDPDNQIETFAYLSNATRGEDERWIEAELPTLPHIHHRVWSLAFAAL